MLNRQVRSSYLLKAYILCVGVSYKQMHFNIYWSLLWSPQARRSLSWRLRIGKWSLSWSEGKGLRGKEAGGGEKVVAGGKPVKQSGISSGQHQWVMFWASEKLGKILPIALFSLSFPPSLPRILIWSTKTLMNFSPLTSSPMHMTEFLPLSPPSHPSFLPSLLVLMLSP